MVKRAVEQEVASHTFALRLRFKMHAVVRRIGANAAQLTAELQPGKVQYEPVAPFFKEGGHLAE